MACNCKEKQSRIERMLSVEQKDGSPGSIFVKVWHIILRILIGITFFVLTTIMVPVVIIGVFYSIMVHGRMVFPVPKWVINILRNGREQENKLKNNQ